MRNTFINELILLARQHKHLALVVGDLGYSVVEEFAEEFPDRFINAGVAEQNMTALAAGMASEGYHVFTYSIANFPTFRCAEQIRNDIAYHNLAVTVVSVGGGLAYGALGYSHHAVQDYALIRCMPNMQIASPGDRLEVRACLRHLVNYRGPSYLRLGKGNEFAVKRDVPHIDPGEWYLVSGERGQDKALVTTGTALEIGFDWLKRPEYSGYSLYSVPVWGMAFKMQQISWFKLFREIVTIEDHLVDGGFGSWLLESRSQSNEKLSCNMKIMALDPKVCGTVGSQKVLNSFGGLG
jgi:transketolase